MRPRNASRRLVAAGIGASLLLLQVGCMSTPKRDPAFAAARPAAVARPQPMTGAIYQVGFERRLYEDRRARRVGDLVTIVLAENTDAKVEADTDLIKDSDTDISNPLLLGSPVNFSAPGILPLLSNSNNSLQTQFASSTDFEGESETSQRNKLTGSITVTVAEVLPNGYLYVQGEKLMALNKGDEYIRISGIIRPDDIQTDNTVLSTKLADAQIAYAGRGPMNDANSIGWLARFFISAIFPF